MTYVARTGPYVPNLGNFDTLAELLATHPATLYNPGTTAYAADQGIVVSNGSVWEDVGTGGSTALTAATYAAARLISGVSTGDRLQVLGRTSQSDGGQGLFTWVAGETTTIDNGIELAATGGIWRRAGIFLLDPKMLGLASFTFATLPTAAQMVNMPKGIGAYTTDQGSYVWNATTWLPGVSTLQGYVTPTISGVSITGTAGQLAFTGTGWVPGSLLTISGVYGGTGSIVGYSNPTTYYVSATNGTSTLTLQSYDPVGVTPPAPIVTTAGTPIGLTYTPVAAGTANLAYGFSTLASNTTGFRNTAAGYQALLANLTGLENAAYGYLALTANTTGVRNTAIGSFALNNNTTGSFNTAVGSAALPNNTTGSQNSAVGEDALYNNTTGSFNTAVGLSALNANTTGSQNSAVGLAALTANTTGSNNTASGYNAAAGNTTGTGNSAFGSGALSANTTGTNNVAVGANAAFNTDAVNFNTAVGYTALQANVSGTESTAVGSASLNAATGRSNTAIGYRSLFGLTSGTFNVGVGYKVGLTTLATGSNNVLIGTSSNIDTPAAGTSNTIQVGAGSTAVWSATGCGTPSTSVTTIAGSLSIAGSNFFTDTSSNTVPRSTSGATTDTDGFFYIPKVAGTPTGVPANLTGNYANALPMRYDTTNHKLWVYDGAWKGIVLI